jgi:uncharacterized protein with ATP-grasp and redox domains
MKLSLDCIPCFQKQALQAARFITDDEKFYEQVLRKVMEKLLNLRWDSTPPEMAHRVHKIVRRLTRERYSYKGVKKGSNDLVLKIYPGLRIRWEERRPA